MQSILKRLGGLGIVWIKKSEITSLSENIRRSIDGQTVDFRDNQEGVLSILKNDIHTFINLKSGEKDVATTEHKFLSDYVASISHQLKTPLTSVQLMIELLENTPQEKQAEFIYNIKTSLAQMDWLTTALLKMARLDSKMIDFTTNKVKVSTLLKSAITPLEILLDVKSQSIKLCNDINLICDSHWTSEALTNLLKNAIEYSAENSTILIDSGINPIYNWISITDTGEGIKKEDIGSIWIRFTGSRSKNGNGIGLPLALSIVRGQNGDIYVDGGGKGVGATFTIKFFK